MSPFELRMLPLDQLIPADYNPRTMPAKAKAKLRASLDTFGLVEPLIWNRRNGHVVGGHQRLALLREMGVAEVPVSVVELSDTEEKALNVVLNNLEAQGRYEPMKLAEILRELEPLPELAATGFTPADLKALELQREPVQPLDDVSDVTVTLSMTGTTYDAVTADLDAIIAAHDVVSHVRRGPLSARRCNATTVSAATLP